MPYATLKTPAEPALVPWRKVLPVGYLDLANWIAALVAKRPLVERRWPSGVLLGLFGSGWSPPV